MLNSRLTVVCLVFSLLPASLNASEDIQISRKHVAEYLKDPLEKYASDSSDDWEDRMYRLLAAKRDPDAAALALAQQDQLSVADEKALMSLWMAHAKVRDSERALSPEESESQRRALKRQALETVRASGYAALVVRIAVRVMEDRDCKLEDFDALVAKAINPLEAGLAAADEAGCTSWWLALHARFPSNTTVLTELSRTDGGLALPDRLALLERLNSPSQAAQDSRQDLMRDYISELWRGGLIADGLAIFNSASNADRRVLLNTPAATGRRSEFRLEYIAALKLTGQVDAARKALDQLPYTLKMRSLWDCLGRKGVQLIRDTSDGCEGTGPDLAGSWQLLESTLNREKEDPYLLIEGGLPLDYSSALWIEIMRRRLTGDNYESIRRRLAESWVADNLGAKEPEMIAMLARFMDDDFRRRTSGYEAKMRAAVVPWNVTVKLEPVARQRHAATPPPLPRGFRELSVPVNLRTKRSGNEKTRKWPDGVAELPKGFYPVRVERGSPFSIAVSLSQNLDPVGEVSAGGYWIHVSRDGGASWSEPLYTGMLEYFPYVVLPRSKMPLWSGDRITIEVVVRELDPESITYPPVALRSRRQASDLYLEIPLAALESDRDHDGITDIVEDHLLLNPDNADSDGDGLADGRDPLPNVKHSDPSRDNDYVAELLQHIFHLPEGAIIEPVDRDPDLGVAFQGKFAEQPSTTRPLLVEGNPADFSALRTTLPVLVYSAADVERLRAHSPDFHALSLGEVVFNRARDRGFVWWSRGWTGGTLRLIREGNAWRIEVLSSWIT